MDNKKKMSLMHVRLDQELLDWIDEQSSKYGMSKTAYVRYVLTTVKEQSQGESNA